MRVKQYDTKITKRDKKLTLVKEKEFDYDIEKMSSPAEVYQLLKNTVDAGSKSEEHLYMIALNTKGVIIGLFLCARGSINSAMVDPGVIFKKALLCNAASIILAHNHPSGDATPSEEDVRATKRIEECGKLMNIPLTDHIIVTQNGFTSLRQQKIF